MILEHANMTVSDVRRSAKFYGDLLDLKIRWEGQTNQGWPAIHIGDEKSYLALFQSPKPTTLEEDYERVGINHFGFVVEDLDAATKRLAILGVTHKGEINYEPGRRVYFYDPDGIEIELVEYPKQTNNDRETEKSTNGAR